MSIVSQFKVLGDESRLRILRVLLTGRYSVNELVIILRMGQSRVSRHLKLLVDNGLTAVRREGAWAYYEIAQAEPDSSGKVLLELLRSKGEGIPNAAEDDSRRLQCLEGRRERSRVFHDRVAPQWSRLRRELFGDGKVTEKILQSSQGASVVADLGCGAGELLPKMQAMARRVIGVDASPAMLEEAGRLARSVAADGGTIELRLGTLEHLPLADGEADVALLNMVLHHLADPKAVFQEVRRILAPGGRIAVCDLKRHDQEWMREKHGDQWLGFNEEELKRFLSQARFRLISLEQFDNAPHPAILLAVAQRSKQGGK